MGGTLILSEVRWASLDLVPLFLIKWINLGVTSVFKVSITGLSVIEI